MNRSVVSDIEVEIQKVEAIAEIYFRQVECCSLRRADKNDILGILRWLVTRCPYDPNRLGRKTGKKANPNTYAQGMVKNAHKIWRKLQEPSFLQIKEFKEDHVGVDMDPLAIIENQESTVAKLSDIYGDVLELHAPPYTVKFTSESRLADYWENPYHVPTFELIPLDPDKLAVHHGPSGRRMTLNHAELSDIDHERLEAHRLRSGTALKGLIEDYL
jgi:hypothetical protein